VRPDNPEQQEKTESPRIETEEGTVKDFKHLPLQNAAYSIMRMVARDATVTLVNLEQPSNA
jgi:hypothetical protein